MCVGQPAARPAAPHGPSRLRRREPLRGAAMAPVPARMGPPPPGPRHEPLEGAVPVLAGPGRRAVSSGGLADAQPATPHGPRRRASRLACPWRACEASRARRCASGARRRRSAGASVMWARLSGPWAVSSCSPHSPPRRPWQPERSLRSLAAHERRSEAVGGVELAVARALGRRVEAPGRPQWPMVRRAARRTARHAARAGRSARQQPRGA